MATGCGLSVDAGDVVCASVAVDAPALRWAMRATVRAAAASAGALSPSPEATPAPALAHPRGARAMTHIDAEAIHQRSRGRRGGLEIDGRTSLRRVIGSK